MEPLQGGVPLLIAVIAFGLGTVATAAVHRRRTHVTLPIRLAEAVVVDASEAAQLDPWIEFQRELKRSRRTARPLALLRFFHADAHDERAQLELAASLAAHVRDVDRVWIEPGEIFVLLPETDPREATLLAGRLEREATAVMQRMSLAIACFPTDALTGEDLVAQLRGAAPAIAPATPSLRVAGGTASGPLAVPESAPATQAVVTNADPGPGTPGNVAS